MLLLLSQLLLMRVYMLPEKALWKHHQADLLIPSEVRCEVVVRRRLMRVVRVKWRVGRFVKEACHHRMTSVEDFWASEEKRVPWRGVDVSTARWISE